MPCKAIASFKVRKGFKYYRLAKTLPILKHGIQQRNYAGASASTFTKECKDGSIDVTKVVVLLKLSQAFLEWVTCIWWQNRKYPIAAPANIAMAM